MVTLTASVYHPLPQSQVILATMQVKQENHKFVEIFWQQFNEAYKNANGICTMFSHVGWCTDMASSNFSGMSAVFVDEILEKMNGCEFHFH